MTIEEYMKKKKINALEFSNLTGIHYSTIKRYLQGRTRKLSKPTRTKLEKLGIVDFEGPIYTLYKGERFIFSGTLKECANELGVKESTIHYYSTPTHKKKVKDGPNRIRAIIESERNTSSILSELENYRPKAKEDVVGQIRYIIKNKKGVVYLAQEKHAEELTKWLKSRGYNFKRKRLKQGDYEFEFAKVG